MPTGSGDRISGGEEERMPMNSQTANIESWVALPAIESTPSSPAVKGRKLWWNGHVAIFSLALALALFTANECYSITHIPSLLYGLALWVWWACVASALWKIGERVPLISSLTPMTGATHVLAASALGVVHLLLIGSCGFSVAGWQVKANAVSVWTSEFGINRFGMELLMYGFVFGLTAMIQLQIRSQREAMRSLELQRQLSAAHLRALQMQMEPHFLFNTLNAITTLVELGRQKAAAEMLGHLNALLKTTLARTTPEKVPLSQELEFVGNYLAIEQVRFADRLRVEMNVDPSAVDGLVPSFLLQPIVENAIRHGIARCEHYGLVEASAIREGEELHLRVRDTGSGMMFAQQNGHGIGLSNTRERLDHFYHDGYKMQAQPLSTGGFEVAITIPYECQGV
jgi:sensor histidine kinase YesM